MMRSPCLRIPIQLSIQVTMHIDQSQPRKQQTLYKHHVIGQTFKAKPLSNLNYIKHAQDKTRKIFFLLLYHLSRSNSYNLLYY